ncbi:MAG: type I-U CRISPR-associated protein Csb2 [Pirellulales bacterium]
MPSFLNVSVNFLDRDFHGRRDGGEPEWPPSPLRLFQALVSTGASRWRESQFDDRAAPAFRWLEESSPPIIVGPASVKGASYRLSVPNNAMDIVGRAWVRGNTSGEGDADPRTHRAMKTVSPVRLANDDPVNFLWELPESAPNAMLGFVETLCITARSLVALGWGIDLVAGNGRVVSQQEADSLPGERWLPLNDSSFNGLRVPIRGTLTALTDRHLAFLNRLPQIGGFNPVPPLSAFRMVGYRRATDPPARPFAAFQLLKPDASGYRAFNTVRHARTVAGMVRHVTAQGARSTGWPEKQIACFVLGHGESYGEEKHVPVGLRRFAYLPIPSLEHRGERSRRVVGSVRRVLVTCLAEGCEREIEWARRVLSGMELVDNHRSELALLSLLPASDRMIRDYTDSAESWSTVTPVILPGFDDRDSRKGESLLRKAIAQAGFSDVLARFAELECQKVGFLPGTDLARRYSVPDYLRNYSAYHVRVTWRDAHGAAVSIPGPICIGGGRFIGLGLFAADRQ